MLARRPRTVSRAVVPRKAGAGAVVACVLIASGAALIGSASAASAAPVATSVRTVAVTSPAASTPGLTADESPAPGTLSTSMLPSGSPDGASVAAQATPGSVVAHAATCGSLGPSAASSMPLGIDVASYQHPSGASIDWGSVSSAGRRFTIVKATEFTGASSVYTNPYMASDVAGARAAGMYASVYHFARPQYSATAQADAFAAAFNSLGGTLLPPVLDLEANGGLSAPALVGWTQSFLGRLQADTGRLPMIYTGPSFWQNSLGDSTAFTAYPLWVAHYTTCSRPESFGGWSSWTLWQYDDGSYAETTAIPGIGSDVDRNRAASASVLNSLATGTFLGTATSAQYPEGSFVAVAGSPQRYRIAGLSPQLLTAWSVVGGSQPYQTVTANQFFQLRGTPTDGTFINAGGPVYRIAGGAPMYVSAWAAVGGVQPVIHVDPAVIDNAGTGGYFGHLNAAPADGTFIRTIQDGAVYEIAGDAPVRVSSWAPFGRAEPYTNIDTTDVMNAGQSGVWRFLRTTPADGTFVSTIQDGAVYRMAGGAPVYVTTWAAFGGSQPFVRIDQAAVSQGGSGTYWNHILQHPVAGTYIRGVQTGEAYQIDSTGHPVDVANWTDYDGTQEFTDVDQTTIDNMGGTGVFSHLAS